MCSVHYSLPAQQSCFTTVVMSEWQLRSSSWEHLPSGTLWSWKTALVIELNTACCSVLLCLGIGQGLKYGYLLPDVVVASQKCSKDHKTHFPQSWKLRLCNSRLVWPWCNLRPLLAVELISLKGFHQQKLKKEHSVKTWSLIPVTY